MISIIGAGPAGNYLAYLLAKNGMDVQVFEEHNKIGEPVQCTGIVSSRFSSIIDPKKDFVINKIDKVRIYSPKKDHISLKTKTNYILDRTKFDKHLAELAKKAGAKYFLGYRFISHLKKGNRIKIKFSNKEIFDTDYLVGADGPLSQVAKSAGIFGNRSFLIGTQAMAKKSNDNCVEFYPLEKGFAWVVPENKRVVRIGIAAYKKTNVVFERFIENKIQRKDIIKKQAGIIPLYNPSIRTHEDRIYLLGDAATMVKATTGGGIVQGLLAAESLFWAITDNKNYTRLWKNKIGKDLFVHLLLRKIMDRFNETEWDRLIHLFQEPRLKKVLEHESRDNMIRLGLKIIMKKPEVMLYTRFLL